MTDPTRRAFMAGAAALAPLATTATVAEPEDRQRWERALAALQIREAAFRVAIDAGTAAAEAMSAWHRANPAPPGTAFVPGDEPVLFKTQAQISGGRQDRWRAAFAEAQKRLAVGEAHDREIEAGDRFLDALDEVLACPAPDLTAVGVKIELALKYDAALDNIQAELRRFSGPGAGGAAWES